LTPSPRGKRQSKPIPFAWRHNGKKQYRAVFIASGIVARALLFISYREFQ